MSSDEEDHLNQTFSTMRSAEEDINDNHPPTGSSSTSNTAQNEGPIHIATISSGFEQSDFLVRELKGQRVYFDFFEEAFNYLASKGYVRMKGDTLKEWMTIIESAHNSIPDGTTYRTGVLIMVMSRPVEYVHVDHGNNTNSHDMNVIKEKTTNGVSRKTNNTNGIQDDEENESPLV